MHVFPEPFSIFQTKSKADCQTTVGAAIENTRLHMPAVQGPQSQQTAVISHMTVGSLYALGALLKAEKF